MRHPARQKWQGKRPKRQGKRRQKQQIERPSCGARDLARGAKHVAITLHLPTRSLCIRYRYIFFLHPPLPYLFSLTLASTQVNSPGHLPLRQFPRSPQSGRSVFRPPSQLARLLFYFPAMPEIAPCSAQYSPYIVSFTLLDTYL
jgi:hypothetical protein